MMKRLEVRRNSRRLRWVVVGKTPATLRRGETLLATINEGEVAAESPEMAIYIARYVALRQGVDLRVMHEGHCIARGKSIFHPAFKAIKNAEADEIAEIIRNDVAAWEAADMALLNEKES